MPQNIGATLDDASALVEITRTLTDQAVARAADLTSQGRAIDDHQVIVERVAYAATEARAARELVEAAASEADTVLQNLAIAGAAELFRSSRDRLEPVLVDLNLDAAFDAAVGRARVALRNAGHESL